LFDGRAFILIFLLLVCPEGLLATITGNSFMLSKKSTHLPLIEFSTSKASPHAEAHECGGHPQPGGEASQAR
jgi:hypothetical protein